MTEFSQPSQFSEILCPHCNSHFFISTSELKSQAPRYCSFCSKELPAKEENEERGKTQSDATFIPDHIPAPETIQFHVGHYKIIKSIGKGGMGEVFLAYDPICGRRIALKQIRTDLREHKQLYSRFLKEARITSQLTHPGIIPIYSIHQDQSNIYYTMPYVEGENLKQIVKKTKMQEQRGEKLDHVGGSIPALMRIFVYICQSVAYAHSKGILHRDLKPENVIIGKFGEVLILDWGLAKLTEEAKEKRAALTTTTASSETITSLEIQEKEGLTRLGKVVGTISYMAPERGLGAPANIQTDIYSLGVILYQCLTLHLPFQRKNLEQFRKNVSQEKLTDPTEVAPYRDVPKVLSQICHICLETDVKIRYRSVDDLIRDIENYLEGRSEWFQIAKLDINQKQDWEFQENVLIAEHIVITRGTEMADWVSLMISKESFSENVKIEAKVRLEDSHGIGFLFAVPEAAEREHLNDGYCLWLGSAHHRSTKLLHSSIEVFNAPDTYLKPYEWVDISIKKIDNKVSVSLNKKEQFSYISHLPAIGTHIGLLARDANFQISDLNISVGNQNVMVNCLAIPDAFLAHKDYAKALIEYRRIAYTFAGRAEGREGLFRAGITLLEQAKNCLNEEEKEELYDLSRQEFEKLKNTPGAPLEYLGKALIYQANADYEEEIKCYAIALRRHHKHPLLHILEAQVNYRLHESAKRNRKATYELILLQLQHMPEAAASTTSQKLFKSLRKHWESLPFFEQVARPQTPEKEKIAPEIASSQPQLYNLTFGQKIAFWLAKPYIIAEMIDQLAHIDPLPSIALSNALFSLIELGSYELAKKKIGSFTKSRPKEQWAELKQIYEPINWAILSHLNSIEDASEAFFALPRENLKLREMSVLCHILEQTLTSQETSMAEHIFRHLSDFHLTETQSMELDIYKIWVSLLKKEWEQAGKILMNYPIELLNHEINLLYFLYGCWLSATEGHEVGKTHFSGILEVSHPRTWTLAAHFIRNSEEKNQRWLQSAFLYEKRALYRQLTLYFTCIGENEKAQKYQQLEKEYWVKVS